LNSEYKPLSFTEVDDEVRKYGEYVRTFDAGQAGATQLNYLIAPSGRTEPFFAVVDKWYERDAGEVYGKYVLYKLKLRKN
jgi:hypothetical protein